MCICSQVVFVDLLQVCRVSERVVICVTEKLLNLSLTLLPDLFLKFLRVLEDRVPKVSGCVLVLPKLSTLFRSEVVIWTAEDKAKMGITDLNYKTWAQWTIGGAQGGMKLLGHPVYVPSFTFLHPAKATN
jgi:hypothetical protein